MNKTEYISPTFFIIGERKCGTSSLYRYLVQHPNILPCFEKEPNFFGKGAAHVQQHIDSYWSLFPKKVDTKNRDFIWPELNEQGILYEETVSIPRVAHQKYITGEASANTFYEVAPELVKKYLPKIKLIILLRNPIDRAFSHHRMYQRFQEEGRELGFQVNSFETDILAEIELIQTGRKGQYLTPSIYLPNLKNWIATFGASAIRIYFTEDLKVPKKATAILKELEHFLGIPHFDYGNYLSQQFNKAPSATFSNKLREQLLNFFQGYNAALFEYLKEVPNCYNKPNWETFL